MQVLVHCDDHICRDEELISRVEGVIAGTLERFNSRISRVEAYLRDLNSAKPGARDKGCSLEVRLAGGAAVLASHEAATLAEAIHAAADKLKRLITLELQQRDEALGTAGTDSRVRPS